MNVLMLSTDTHALAPNSGVRNRFCEYAKEFNELHILVLSTTDGDPVEQIADNAWIYNTGSWLKWFIPLDGVKLGNKIGAAHKIDVVTVQDPFEVGHIGLRIAKAIGARFHVQVHTDIGSQWFTKDSGKNKVRVSLAGKILKEAHAIRAVSQRVKRGLMHRWGGSIVEPTVLPIVGGLTGKRGEVENSPFPFTMLVIGRLAKEKHLQTAVEVLRIVQKSYPRAGIAFIGEGPEKTVLEEYVRARGLMRSVHFAGQVKDVGSWFSRGHCLLHTAAYEGYGRVLIEAALHKVPIVTTDVGVVGEVFTMGADVFSCPVDDVKCLSAGARHVLNDVYARQILPRRAYDKAVAHIAKYPNYSKMFAEDIRRALT